MTADQQYWLNWVVNALVAVGTLGAVGVALFGNIIRSIIWPPSLQVHLLSKGGERGKIKYPQQTNNKMVQVEEDARYYHLSVSNNRVFSPAEEVQVHLRCIEEPGPDGDYQTVWRGRIPMAWRNQQVSPLTYKIGTPRDSDFIAISSAGWLKLLPLIEPYNLEVVRNKPCKFVASLQATSNQSESIIIRVEVSWDGKWDESETEMRNHLIIKELIS